MMGDLFSHPISPGVLKEMDYAELVLWHEWVELNNREWKKLHGPTARS